jgi:hypothetical protein
MLEDRTSRGDVALWCLAGVMTLVLFLSAPQLSADNTGRVVTVVISAAIFACSVHPTLHSPWLHSSISRRIVLCFVAVGIAAYGVDTLALFVECQSDQRQIRKQRCCGSDLQVSVH